MPRSRKKPPTESAPPVPAGKYRVLRDTCEKEGHGWVFPESSRCDGTVSRNLFTGDYRLEGYYEPKLFVVERKGRVAELVGNITLKEKWDDFKDELTRLEGFRHPYVICEFPFSHLKTYPVHSGIPRERWDSIRVKPEFLLRRMEEI